MKKETLGAVFSKLRRQKKLTLVEIAKRCDVHSATISNIGTNRPTSWETVHLILSVGMDIRPGFSDYEHLHQLWIKHRAEKAESRPRDFATRTIQQHASEATRKFRALIRNLGPEATMQVLAAARRKAGKLKEQSAS